MSKTVFKRKIYNKLLEWKEDSAGKTALLVEGARRVGKSTIVKKFASEEYESYILVDFATASKTVRELFDDVSDLNYIFLQLQLQYHTDLHERNSIIIFDEVQLCPKARQAIKALVADGRYDYIETGSFIYCPELVSGRRPAHSRSEFSMGRLSRKRNVSDILIPSEERKISMYPMDYEEFLWAKGDSTTMPLIRSVFESGKSLGDDMNRRLMRDFRLYMLVGGMPQAVSEYLETNNLRKVDLAKRDILNLYHDDFMKIDSTGRLSLLFDNIPTQLNKNASRYQTAGVLGSESTDTTLNLISQLKESQTVLISYHVNDPNAGMSANKDISRFKLFMSDTGLFTTQMFADKDFTENVIYDKLLNDKLGTNLGYLYENIVAQTLVCSGNDLFYYTFPNEATHHNYEIDFLISRKNKICPIEVKSSGYKTHASLDAFCDKYSDRILDKYIIYTKDYRKDQDICCIPFYMAAFL